MMYLGSIKMGAIHRVIPDDRPGQVWIYVNSKDSKPNTKEYPFEEGW